MTTLHRAQILLETPQHEALAEIAQEEGRSISDLVREIVARHLAERDPEAQKASALQALQRLSQIRAGLHDAHGIFLGDPLEEVRAEWDGDVERIWRGES